MPTCWFCGVTVLETRVCPRCKQEFGECHSDPATHDCPGVQVSSPYVTPKSQTENHGNEVVVPETGFSCAFCGQKVDYSSKCEECQRQFCIDHARPEDHSCASIAGKISEGSDYSPIMETTEEQQLIPTPKPLRHIQKGSSQQKPQDSPTTAIPPLPTVPKPPLLPKINISAAQTDIVVGQLLQACKDCSKDPDLHSTLDPILGEFIQSDPDVLQMFKKFAQDTTLRGKFQKNPLTRGLYIWFDAVGEDLDALSEIGDEVKVPITQLSLHELLHYYYAHLTDVASLLEARDTGGHPRVNPLERWIQSEIGEEAKGSLTIAQDAIDDIAKLTREAGERETLGYLVGNRDVKGNIALVSKCVPLLLGEENECFSSSRELYEVLQPIANTNEKVVGIFHSHPGNSLPALSEQDTSTHIAETYRLSLFECLKQLDVKLTFNQRVNLSFCLSTYDYAQIRYLVDVIFATIVFPPAIKPISDIVMNDTSTWEVIKGKIDAIIQKVGITPTPVDWPLLPFVDVVISPDYRFIGAGGLSIDPDLEHPGEIKPTPFFYHIHIKSETDQKE